MLFPRFMHVPLWVSSALEPCGDAGRCSSQRNLGGIGRQSTEVTQGGQQKARPGCAVKVLQEGDPFQDPRASSYLTLGNELSKETHMSTKQETLLRRVAPGGEQEGKGTQENSWATWLAVWGFMVMGLVSGLSLANHSDSGSFLVAYTLLSQDGFQQKGF